MSDSGLRGQFEPIPDITFQSTGAIHAITVTNSVADQTLAQGASATFTFAVADAMNAETVAVQVDCSVSVTLHTLAHSSSGPLLCMASFSSLWILFVVPPCPQ